ncbi:MAG: pteridine reductase [Betaproteobacteria bacterium]|jgi:pteridine reductase|nr:pteridine reductase [Betaproteobacteria bacterium]
MDQLLQHQCALVTGGARRVGAAIVRRLHAAGANVVVHCHRSRDAASVLAAELNALRPASAVVACADLLDTAALPGLAAQALSAFGRLDLLVNNASSFYPTPIDAIDEAQWLDLIGTNLKAPLFLARAAAPALRERGGAIVNIIDIHAERPMRDHLIYNAAKGGLAALTRALALDLGPQVRVNGVSPGAIVWPEAGAWEDPAEREAIVRRTILGRTGAPEDIAGAVLYLAGAPYVTGQILAVDGGRSIVL